MTDDRLRIVLAQLNFMVGDVQGNAARIIEAAGRARDQFNAGCVVFPELALTGYPPEDLLLRPALTDQVSRSLTLIRNEVADIDVILGYPRFHEGRLYNAASLLRGGSIVASYHKQRLPNYSVFDEMRYFTAGSEPCVVTIGGFRVGLTICEDIWQPGAVEQAAAAGARLTININASPYHVEKRNERESVLRHRVAAAATPIVYLNTVGGQDELVFDGESFVMDARGEIAVRAPAWEETLIPVDFTADNETGADRVVTPLPGPVAEPLDPVVSMYRGVVLGVRDYVDKNRFAGVVVGVSGGIDSALTLAVAADALGPERVTAVLMPSRYTAPISVEDARAEAEALGVAHYLIPIEPAFEAFLDMLSGVFAGTPADITEENLQARCRGVVLMAISNKQGTIVLTTGNKSELAVGYATLYGDMAGGFAPLKDVPKTLVYRLVRYRNSQAPVIPQRVLDRAPSAELAPDQRDEDSLPPYEILDQVLEMYIEKDMSPDEIIAAGFVDETVKRIVRLVDRNEYKRRQTPPGVRISRRAFGRDRRYPITSGFQGNIATNPDTGVGPDKGDRR